MMSKLEAKMKIALQEAEQGRKLGEVPVGAAIFLHEELISVAHNEVESSQQAVFHAEVLAIQRASDKLNKWRLTEAELFVTLEPCTMCLGAITQARIGALYFGAHDLKMGACGSIYDLTPIIGKDLKIYGGLLENESSELLKSFFQVCRSKE